MKRTELTCDFCGNVGNVPPPNFRSIPGWAMVVMVAPGQAFNAKIKLDCCPDCLPKKKVTNENA